MKRILLAAALIGSNTLYGQKSDPWLRGIVGCFTNNYFQASMDFTNGSTLPSGTEKANIYLTDLAAEKEYAQGNQYPKVKDSVLLVTTILPSYASDKKSATIDFSLSDKLYSLLKVPDDNTQGFYKWALTIVIENSMRSDTASIDAFLQSDSIKLQSNGFFIQVLNTGQYTFDYPFTYKWSKENASLRTEDTTTLLALSEGIYSLFLLGKHCNDTYSISFNPISEVDGMLSVPFVQGASYQWYYKGALLEGAIANGYAATGAGEYTVEVTFPANYTSPIVNTRAEAASVGVYKFNVTDVVAGLHDEEIEPAHKKVVGVYTLLGESVSVQQAKRGAYIFQYSDGSTRKVMITD